jgi:hypothetical protein
MVWVLFILVQLLEEVFTAKAHKSRNSNTLQSLFEKEIFLVIMSFPRYAFSPHPYLLFYG